MFPYKSMEKCKSSGNQDVTKGFYEIFSLFKSVIDGKIKEILNPSRTMHF